MADKKISALTGATTPLAGTEVLPIVQGSTTVKVSVANLTAGRAIAMAGGSFTDNITQSTAAKGVNFITNTPAAGMTSQLLNWYEEGTWTPVVTTGSGSITSYTTTSATYTRSGRTVVITYDITITNNGTGAGYIKIDGLPFNSNGRGFGVGSEAAVVGFSTIQQTIGTTNYFNISKYDGTYPGGTGYQLIGSLTYIV